MIDPTAGKHALAFPSVLSIRYALEHVVPRLAAAAARSDKGS